MTCDDIRGAKPFSRYGPVKKPDSYNVSDIRGTFPNASKALSDRMIDPMAPMYVLPSYPEGHHGLPLAC